MPTEFLIPVPTDFLIHIFVALAFAVVLMLLIWRLALRINNLGIVDIAWSLAFASISIFFAAITSGSASRRWLIAGMVSFWSLRLGTHLYIRVMGHHPREDVRYQELRAKWGKNLKAQSLLFFQIQAVTIVLLSVPFLLTCLNLHGGMTLFEYAGAAIWLIAVGGESLADWQLKQFKANSANKGRVCQQGLWHYSRHPNYFFEWLIWVAYFVFALGSPWGWVTIYCPAAMLFLLLRVTGIPMTEELAVKTKGDEYRDYQRTTSAFVPWFRRK